MICTIEAGNRITTFDSAQEAKAAMSGDSQQFRSAKELAKLAGNWAAPEKENDRRVDFSPLQSHDMS